VRTIINTAQTGKIPGSSRPPTRRLAEAHGIAYHHIPITAATLSRADVDVFAAAMRDAPGPVVAHCRSGTRSTLLWALTRMREGANALSLIAEAAQHGIDIASLPAVAARLR
jgi:uncharacterized protein (TIGR01244 family)